MPEKALSYDGDNDRCYNDALTIEGYEAFSCEAWVKTVDKTEIQHIIASIDQFYLLVDTDSNIITTTVGLSDEYEKWATAALLSNDTWHFIVFTYDGVKKHLYVDGAEVGTGVACTGTFDPTAEQWYVGKSVESWHGVIDEVRISDIARTAVEILANWNGGIGKKLEVDAHTVALWHFDEGEGDIAYDETDNDYDLTIVGPTWTEGKPFIRFPGQGMGAGIRRLPILLEEAEGS